MLPQILIVSLHLGTMRMKQKRETFLLYDVYGSMKAVYQTVESMEFGALFLRTKA